MSKQFYKLTDGEETFDTRYMTAAEFREAQRVAKESTDGNLHWETTKNRIQLYFHCAECLKERPDGQSPKDYQRIQAGWTKQGLQVWCVRHNLSVADLDFKGQKVDYYADS